MIYAVRHGQTDMNKQGRLQGRKGVPLNEEGQKQAERLKERLAGIRFDYVFSSPQERAVQTAEIATGMMPQIDARLDVFDLGEANGLLKNEVKIKNGIPDSQYYKGMEHPEDFIQRIFSFMKELEAYDPKANIFISGHSCTTGAIGAYFHGIPEDGNILKFSSSNGDYKVYRFKS